MWRQKSETSSNHVTGLASQLHIFKFKSDKWIYLMCDENATAVYFATLGPNYIMDHAQYRYR